MVINKKKGFTLIELIIVMSLSIIVITVISAFYFQSRKITTRTEMKSDMQREASNVQDSILNVASQAESLVSLLGAGYNSIEEIQHHAGNFRILDYKEYKNSFNHENVDGEISVRSFILKMPKGLSINNISVNDNDYLKCIYSINDSDMLKCKIEKYTVNADGSEVKDSEVTKNICENVNTIFVKPVNWEELKNDDNRLFYKNVTGLRITVKLKLNRGINNNLRYSIDSIAKFRNKARSD